MDSFLRASSQSMTLAVNEYCKVLEQQGRSVIRFGLGQSPFPPIAAAVEEMKLHTGRKEYAPVPGIPELREAIAKFHNELDGTSFLPEHVFLGPGCKQLIFNVMMCFKTVNVFIPAPAWVSYEPQARLIDHPFVRIAADENTNRMTPEALDAALSKAPVPEAPKLLIFNNPGNPDGQVDRKESLEAFAAVCKKHDVLVIADEIYSLLMYQGKHVSFATVYSKCIVMNGLSKWCGAGGWRIGAAMFMPELTNLMKVFLGVASETYSCIPTPVQVGAVSAYSLTPQFYTYVAAQRKFLSAAGLWAAKKLRSAGIKVNDPQAAFYLWVDFSPFADIIRNRLQLQTSKDLFMRILEDCGVAMVCGTAFGMPDSKYCGRLAFVSFDGAQVLRAVAEVALDDPVSEDFLRREAPMLVEGIERISKFASTLDASK